MTSTILRGGTVLLESGWTRAEVWLSPGGIVGIGPPQPEVTVPAALGPATIVDCSGLLVAPGLIDGHVHLLGGGGGGGYETRIPEIPADALLEAGITTCVAMPGVDNLTRSLETLLAVTRAFTRLGVRAVAMTGGFMWPPRTLTGRVRDDITLIPELVGVKIAVGERLATAPDVPELARLLRELGWAARTTGAAALLHAHLGTDADPGRVLVDALAASGTDPSAVQATHANYTEAALDAAIELGRLGCRIDVNPLLHPGRVAGSIAPIDAIRALLDSDVSLERISLSSDGNASVPRVLPDGTLETFSHQLGLLAAVHDLIAAKVLDSAAAFSLVTRHPAEALGRSDLGRLAIGAAADVVLLREDLTLAGVYSAGVERVREGVALSPSPFRDPRWSAS